MTVMPGERIARHVSRAAG